MVMRRAIAIVMLCAPALAFAFAPAALARPTVRSTHAIARTPLQPHRAPPAQMLAPASVLAAVVAPARRGLATAALAVAAALIGWLVRTLNTPSRVYDREKNTVGREYDAWTSEGILEYYWGEHIHLGYCWCCCCWCC